MIQAPRGPALGFLSHDRLVAGWASSPDFRRAATGSPNAMNRIRGPTLALRGDVPDARHHNSAGTQPSPKPAFLRKKSVRQMPPREGRFSREKFRPPTTMAWRSDAGNPTGAPENAVFGPDTRIFGGLIGGLTWRGQKRGIWGPGTLAAGRPAWPSEPARAKNAVFWLIYGGPLGGLTFWPQNATARTALVVASADAVYPVRAKLEV